MAKINNETVLKWARKSKEYNDKLYGLNEGTASKFVEYLAAKRDEATGTKHGWNKVREESDTNSKAMEWVRLYDNFRQARCRKAKGEVTKKTALQKWNSFITAFNNMTDGQKGEAAEHIKSWLS